MSATRVWDSESSTWVPPDSGNSVFTWDSVSSAGVYTQRYFIHQDNIYNVTAVTDMSGSVVKEYGYDFGGGRADVFTASTPAAEKFYLAYGNTSQRHDDRSTGLMYWKIRYYSRHCCIIRRK